ncbi:MAG: hypothetical protein A2Y95_06090 [Deltaproteobacteria bacterium RBG_13_65_10]|nr:MAG: hypothetical protein A2Y95_06090 [Deltaproteobacteria bacterium RBG_13_65_10]
MGSSIDMEDLRRWIIAAIVSDDEVFEQLVLKGGNALLLHKVTDRASLDFDFSTSEKPTVDFLEQRLVGALKRRLLGNRGLVVFDAEVCQKPKEPDREEWGGFLVTFKLIDAEAYERLGRNDEDAARQSLTIDGMGQGKRIFRIEISPGEFTADKVETEVEDLVCYVYSLRMIVAEKLRAICQQMSEYEFQKTPKPRPRDFYDIHMVQTVEKMDLGGSKFHELVRAVFKAKLVPPGLLGRIRATKEFHESGWPQVLASLRNPEKAQDFDFYFAFVLGEVEKLKALWEV